MQLRISPPVISTNRLNARSSVSRPSFSQTERSRLAIMVTEVFRNWRECAMDLKGFNTDEYLYTNNENVYRIETGDRIAYKSLQIHMIGL